MEPCSQTCRIRVPSRSPPTPRTPPWSNLLLLRPRATRADGHHRRTARACADGGLPSVSFWASVPHYLPAVPSAPAALALLDKLSGLLGMDVDTADLESTADTYQEQVSVAVSQDSDLSSYVRMLEERFDSQADQGPRNLPSGDELAKELGVSSANTVAKIAGQLSRAG